MAEKYLLLKFSPDNTQFIAIGEVDSLLDAKKFIKDLKKQNITNVGYMGPVTKELYYQQLNSSTII